MMDLQKIPIIAIVGPTAIGKTRLSLETARHFNCEVISVDSMQVYKYMDIGTAKIQTDEMEGIQHHLIDIAYPDEPYDAARFVQDATEAIIEIAKKGKTPLLAGGTGLYLKALTDGLFSSIPSNNEIRNSIKERLVREGTLILHKELSSIDPASGARIHPNDASRILRGLEIYLTSGQTWTEHLQNQSRKGQEGIISRVLQIGLTCDRKELYENINRRALAMINAGLEKEVRGLVDMGYTGEVQAMSSLGYRHMLNYISQKWTFDEMLELLSRDTRRYAKRQYTWFNNIRNIEWFDVKNTEEVINRIGGWLALNSFVETPSI